MRITVIGGINMDVLGTPEGSFTLRDSNIGRIRFAPGGVGRNIAAQLAALAADVALVTALGGDAQADILRADCKKRSIGLTYAVQTALPSSCYLCIHDAQGDPVAAINDMAVMNSLTPEALAPALAFINSGAACVLDANLPPEALLYAAQHVQVPLLADPVSCEKALKLLPILPYLEAIKPNLMEAEAMTGCTGYADAARAFLQKGVKQVFISLGAKGVYYANSAESGLLAAPLLPPIPATGSGDAMMAGLALALAAGAPTAECAKRGMDAATKHLINQ